MPTDRFSRALVFITTALAALIGIFIFLLIDQGPRVRFIETELDLENSALTKNTSLTIRFNKLLEDRDYSDQITFTPEVIFNSRTSGQTIVITLKQNLDSMTNYQLTIGPEIFDQSGKSMEDVYTYEIETMSAEFAYIERNYGFEYEESLAQSNDKADHIIQSYVGGDSQSIFSHPQIVMFTLNRDSYVVLVREETTDAIYIVNRESLSPTRIELEAYSRIDNLVLSPQGNIALFTRTPDFDSVSREIYDRDSMTVLALDLSNHTVSPLTHNEENIKASFIEIEPQGRIAVIQNLDQTFSAISPYADFEPILIGTYSSSLGFNEDSTEVVFRNNSDFLIYPFSNSEVRTIDPILDGYVQQIYRGQNTIFISSSTFFAGETRTYLNIFDSFNDSTPEIVWSNLTQPTNTLREISVSFDNNYVALQQNPKACTFDLLTTNGKCKRAFTEILRVDNQEIVSEFRGFDTLWLP